MTNKKMILLVLAGLALGILLTLLLAPRKGGRRGESPGAPASAEVSPPPPAPVPVKIRVLPAVELPTEKRRELRVSSLGDPGEAMGGGVRLDLPDKTTGETLDKK